MKEELAAIVNVKQIKLQRAAYIQYILFVSYLIRQEAPCFLHWSLLKTIIEISTTILKTTPIHSAIILINITYILNMKEEDSYQINRKITFKPNVEVQANCLSKIFFIWTRWLMRAGAEKPLEMDDLYELKPEEEPEYAYVEFCRGYDSRETDSKSRTKYAFWKLLGGSWFLGGILSVFANVLQFAGPLMIKQILQFISGTSDDPDYMGYIWASVLVGSYLLRTLFLQHAFHAINEAAVKCMNSSTSKIYFKILRLSSASRKYLQTGSIMNYINVDTQAFSFFIQMSSFLFSAPFMILISIGLIIVEVGWIGLCAPLIFLMGLYFQQKFMKSAFALRKDQLFWTDKRSKCVNQYFSGIRVVKYYGWEQIVSTKIESIRKEELKLNFKSLMLRSYIEILMNMMPIIASVIVFGVYVAVNGGDSLKTENVYTTLSLFNLMANPMRMLVMTVVQMANANASLTRVDHFFQFPDSKQDDVNSKDTDLQLGEIQIDDAEFRWETNEAKKHNEEGKKLVAQDKKGKKDKKQEKKPQQTEKRQSVITTQSLREPLLDDDKLPEKEPEEIISLKINRLHIRKGQHVGVIGQVGSGKSTLLSALLNEVDKVKGTVRRNGTCAYIPQVSWLRSDTIRDNILFESEYNEVRYKDVIKRCELESDFDIFPGGDLTEVGERGVNLSGGQKQRISIARALYANADIYLIDDCLSALDSYVSKKIYTNVIRDALRQKTVIFVTHAIEYVHEADHILVMENGEVYEQGTYEELHSNPNSLYNTLEVQYKKQAEKEEQAEAQKKEKEQAQLRKKKSEAVFDAPEEKKEDKKLKALVKVEERTKGSVPWKVYIRFFTGAGASLTISTFIFIFLGQLARIAGDWWLGCWSSGSFDLSQQTYIQVYAGASILIGSLIYFKGLLFAKFITESSQTIQRKLIEVLLHTPLSWFDVTPTGRIISRTTKDQDDLDSNLAFNVQFTIQNVLVALCSILVIGVATPVYFAVAAGSLVLYYFLIRYYMHTAVELKRLQANTRAPLISHIQETINGMYVIRAFDRSSNFIGKYFQRQKQYIVAYTNQNVANRWISLFTDLFSVLTIAACAYLGVAQRPDPNDPEKHKTNLIGLALTWSLQISAVMSFTLKLMADTESNMNAVIRLLDYIDNNPSEKDFNEPLPPDDRWPADGEFKIDKVTYRYRPDLEDVIHGISFDVKSKAKIGVVGRTGSGKSTLTLGLLRIMEISNNKDGTLGHIDLDKVNIANVGLHCLRHKVTIIPQDPTLFTGTVKSNIDPFNVYAEEDVAECLKQVEIWQQIRPEPDEVDAVRQKIYSKVDDSGSNFSLGQRQLICLARALIRKPRVLLMDEATASIDEKTDLLLQKMIRREFKETTVITIAHRLNTIINYDKILVLDYGNVKEYGTPLDLVTNEKSFLGKLVKDTGAEFQERMIYLAKKGSIGSDGFNESDQSRLPLKERNEDAPPAQEEEEQPVLQAPPADKQEAEVDQPKEAPEQEVLQEPAPAEEQPSNNADSEQKRDE